MAKIQAHSNTKQINQIQDKAYVVQKQVQQQHFQKLKVRQWRDKSNIAFASMAVAICHSAHEKRVNELSEDLAKSTQSFFSVTSALPP